MFTIKYNYDEQNKNKLSMSNFYEIFDNEIIKKKLNQWKIY